MLHSLKLLIRGVMSHWMQALGGTGMAIVGLVADTQNWTISPGIWYGLSGLLVLWAILRAFHGVRFARDEATEQLKEQRDCQGIANMLTSHYEFGVHELKGHSPGDAERDDAYKARVEVWANAVGNWNEDVRAMMERVGCSQQEISRFWTIDQLRPGMMLRGDVWEKTIRLHETRLMRLWEIVEIYRGRVERLARH